MKPVSNQKSIKSQVIIVIVTGISLMVFSLGLLTVKGINQQTREIMLSTAIQITDGLAQQAVFPILSGSAQNAGDAMEQVLGFRSVVGARLLLEDKSLFLSKGSFSDNHSDNTQTPTLPTIGAKVVKETTSSWLINAPIFILEEENAGDEAEFELEVQKSTKTVIGFAEITYSKDSLIEIQNRVAKTVTLVGIASTLLLSFFLHFALVRLFMPLNRLAEIMHRAKNSGEHLLANVQGAKEINEMSTAYNSMMTVLDSQDEKLKRHRDRLEDEVKMRTKELISARDAAIQASKLKSEFIANMSHELRTPIQSIIGYGELVVEELEVEGHFSLIEDMDKISRNSHRLLQMINSLLDLAKIESGHMALNTAELVIVEFINTLNDTMAPIANKGSNSFAIANNSDIDKVLVDKEKLEHIVLNLLSNAFKFTENGNILLTISSTPKNLVIEVIDNGVGLSEEQQQFIFDEFRQVDASQKRKFSGTGLGLAITRRFVELMSGNIRVDSALGKGSTFTVVIPISTAEP